MIILEQMMTFMVSGWLKNEKYSPTLTPRTHFVSQLKL